MKKLLLIAFIGLYSGLAIGQPELKGSPQDLRGFLYPTDHLVTIYGQAEEKAYSDKAIVSLVITTENERLSLAISDNSALRATLTQSLVDAGISPASIKSSKFSSSPQYGWFGKKPSSYKVVNRMAVSIEKEAHLKEIAVVADRHEEAELSDTTFEHTQKDAFNNRVKAQALKKIITQKEFYEQSLGVKLTPIGIRDSNIRQRATRGALMLETVVATTVNVDREGLSSVSKRQQRPATAPSFDEVKYEANLAVDFKIEP